MKHEDITGEKIAKLFESNQNKYVWLMDIETFKYIQKLQYPDGTFVWEADLKYHTRGLIRGQSIHICEHKCFKLRIELGGNIFKQSFEDYFINGDSNIKNPAGFLENFE